MFNVFESLKQYAQSWNVKEERAFTAEEKACVKSAVVVSSTYGNSVCFTMVSGSQTFIPLSNDATLGVGESVDMDKAQLIVLERDGDKDINRVRI